MASDRLRHSCPWPLLTNLLLIAFFAAAVSAGPIEEIRSASDTAKALVQRAIAEEDGAALATVFAEDGVVIAPTGEVLKGRLTLKASAMLLMMTLGGGDLKVTRHNLNLIDSTGYETGAFTFRRTGSDKSEKAWVGRYTVIWEREAGQWKIARAIGIL
ncbi:MAG: nuclear transport factor 2 family protein [candidate division Zixibacteria bacterium]|nr:nuclear transport factor 2 family protein [candidate division Zixibacteria bacterium]